MTPKAFASRGLSLVEVLVTLVITSFVAGLLGQALFQAARLERELGEVRGGRFADALQVTMIRDAVRAIVPIGISEENAFEGTRTVVRATTVDSPFGGGGAVVVMQLELASSKSADRTELRLSTWRPGIALTERQSVLMLDWPGRPGAFKYLDADGEWKDEWKPTLEMVGRVLPRAIAVPLGPGLDRWLMIPIEASPYAPMSRREVEAL